ncbi:MAG: alkaline phosphatase [Caulobacteraceae bacterium]|nr:alkaline phosphatase [Caulobacteraceae bacterium]
MPIQSLVDRRTLIGWTAALAAGGLGLSQARAAAPANPFQLGVASGEPASDGFVIWTRLAPQPLAPDGRGGLGGSLPVRWEVATDEAMRDVMARGEVSSDPAFAHAIHVEVAGLQPNRPYWYRFSAQGFTSPVGRARTAPAPGIMTDRLRFSFASCSHWELGFFSAYRHMAAENPDLVLFLGDYIYEYSYAADRAGLARRHDRAEEIADLPAYRNRYALYHTDPDLQALHAAAPCIATWDDHEVQNDYSNQWSQNTDATPQAFLRRRAAAYQAFYEHMPLRRAARPAGPILNLYRRLAYGGLAEFTVLDGRQYRSIQPCATPTSRRGHVAPLTCADFTDDNRSMLGTQQEAWLYQGFSDARARWNIVAQDLLVAPFLQKAPDGSVGLYTDGWEGYAGNRTRMLQALSDSRMRNPVFLGGDIHSFWATDLKADFSKPDSPTIATELVGSSITSDGPSYEDFSAMLPQNPFVRYFESRQRGYVSMEIDSQHARADFRVISDRNDPKASVSTLKSFIIEDGKPGAVAV